MCLCGAAQTEVFQMDLLPAQMSHGPLVDEPLSPTGAGRHVCLQQRAVLRADD